MLQIPNALERVHPLEALARSIEDASKEFDITDGSKCAMAHALQLGILCKRADQVHLGHIPGYTHGMLCSCLDCCDYGKAATLLEVDASTLQEIYSGRCGKSRGTLARYLRSLIPTRTTSKRKAVLMAFA